LPYCLYPKVTFLHHDGYEVGSLTAQRMLKLIEEGNTPNKNYKGTVTMLKPPLIELDTTVKLGG
jgi:DNA-binding LacI/PurR family transcriptional regulator